MKFIRDIHQQVLEHEQSTAGLVGNGFGPTSTTASSAAARFIYPHRVDDSEPFFDDDVEEEAEFSPTRPPRRSRLIREGDEDDFFYDEAERGHLMGKWNKLAFCSFSFRGYNREDGKSSGVRGFINQSAVYEVHTKDGERNMRERKKSFLAFFVY